MSLHFHFCMHYMQWLNSGSKARIWDYPQHTYKQAKQ